ncbi:hypothetical protein BH11PSE11_BH11PSE11_19530 [soil metagenome]
MKTKLWWGALAFVFALFSQSVQAATITVAAGAVAIAPGNGVCSLREAINNAELQSDASGGDCVAGTPGPNTIVLAANSVYTILDTDPVQYDFDVYNGLRTIRTPLTINGNGSTIERSATLFSGTRCGGAGAKFRIFKIINGASLSLNNLTIQNGCARDAGGSIGAGGAIMNNGALSLVNTTLTNNEAVRSGGAIHNDGTLTVTQSTISNNAVTTVEAGGGGIVNRGTLNVIQSTISGNTTLGAGGAVDNGNTATFANSTLSGNLASGDGGGIFNRGTTNAYNTTIALNRGTQFTAAGAGSGVYKASGTLNLINSLLAQQANGANCFAVTGSTNSLADDASCTGAVVTGNALIGPLANNGGTTLTHALLAGSPAIDAGNATSCSNVPVSNVDQRGVTRPQNGGNSTTCDIGALEANYGVVYNGNGYTGGSVPLDGNMYANGATVTVLGNTGSLVRTGYAFTGWNTAANGSGTSRAPGSTFAMGGGVVVLYAQWSPVYSVTYNGNTNSSGSAPVDAGLYQNGASVTVLGAGTLVKTGYIFTGWNTAANGSGTARAAASSFAMGAANVTLYAQWTLSVNGVCGTANGVASSFAPTTNLCSVGSASAVSSANGSYSWSCAGTNGGTNASCSANWQTTSGGGTGTAVVTGGTWTFAAQGTGPTQSSGFIPVTGHPKSPPSVPSGFSFPYGLYDFVLTSGVAGSTATITITYPGPIPPNAVYWKYGPSPNGYDCTGAACATPHWYQFPAVMNGNTATLTITDGGVGDDDLTANGVIVDQGGPGAAAAGIPTLSEWAMILLSALMALTAFASLRRRRL